MPELILGPAGSGKTTCALQRLAALAKEGKEPILLIPEQDSLENERRLLEQLPPPVAARIRVLSFSRLADMVDREVGGIAGERLDGAARALLMSRALELAAGAVRAENGGARDLLGVPAQKIADPDVVEQLTRLLEEFRRCAVSGEMLSAAAHELLLLPKEQREPTDGKLRQKLDDLSRILSTYEGLIGGGQLDDLETLDRLAEKLPDSRLPDGASVVVDGFKGFTAQELRVLDRLLPRAADLTNTLGTDTPGRAWPGTPPQACRREDTLFSPVTETVARLRRMAERHRQTLSLCMLTEDRRARHAALAALERGVYAPQPDVFDGDAAAVTVTPCTDVYEECSYVAREIRRLLREDGYRCREITVVVRDLSPYAGLLEDALADAGVPSFVDARQDILCEPLMTYVRCALRLAVGGFTTEELLRLLKTGLGTLTPLETAALEDYAFLWRIDGQRWMQPFTDDPRGLGSRMNDAARQRLALLESYRQRAVQPVAALREALRAPLTGRAFAEAVYAFLCADEGIAARIAQQAAVLRDQAEEELAAHAEQLWDELIRILDRFALTMGETVLPAARFEELFTMLARLIDMGRIPQGLDAVTVGTADRIRYTSPRAVFILGANEGEFPAYPAGGSLLTEDDRRRLAFCGVQTAQDVLTQCIEERYFVYTAVAAPSERLTVTYRTCGGAVPSPLIAMIDQILPHHRVDTAERDDGADLETAQECFARLSQRRGVPDAVTAAMGEALSALPQYAGRMAAADRAAGRAPWHLEDPAMARGLFGTDLCLSASRTDRFYRCRFSYFCRYGLEVQQRRPADVDAALFGTVVHEVMEKLLLRFVRDGTLSRLRQNAAARANMAPADAAADEAAEQERLNALLSAQVHEAAERLLREELGGREGKSGSFLYRIGLAERAAVNMLWHTLMELRQSEFVPQDMELPILPKTEQTEGEDAIFALRLPFSRGTVSVTGKIDRVDLYVRPDGTAFVRVVDYKTGKKDLKLSEVAMGLNTQMLLYLFIVCDNSRRYLEGSGELQPAGVLYRQLSDLAVVRSKGDMMQARLKSMCMKGVVLDDPGIIQAMEQDAQGVFIPAKLGKAGETAGSTVTKKQFMLLRGVVEQLLTGMAEQLMDGDIAALPLKTSDRSPCEWCDYRPVCARDADDPVRTLPDDSNAAVLAALEEQEEQEETADGEGEHDGARVDG